MFCAWVQKGEYMYVPKGVRLSVLTSNLSLQSCFGCNLILVTIASLSTQLSRCINSLADVPHQWGSSRRKQSCAAIRSPLRLSPKPYSLLVADIIEYGQLAVWSTYSGSAPLGAYRDALCLVAILVRNARSMAGRQPGALSRRF